MKYISLILLAFMINLSVVQGLSIEDNLNQISQNIQAIEEEQKSRNLLNKIYPVGSIYITTTSTNPSSTLGGTWQAYAQGRTLVGVDGSSYTSASATGGKAIKTLATGNLPAHTHSASISGKVTSTFYGSSVATSSSGHHSHTIPVNTSGSEASGYSLDLNGNGFSGRIVTYTYAATNNSSSNGAHTHTLTPAGSVSSTFKGTTSNTSAIGSGSSVNFQNPYITVYIWKRTA